MKNLTWQKKITGFLLWIISNGRLIPPFEKGASDGIFFFCAGSNPSRFRFLKAESGVPRLTKILAELCFVSLTLYGNTLFAQHTHPSAPSSAPTVGNAAVPFELKTLDGKPAALDTFRGKPLVLNFFASWCDPCRDEMPLINDLAAKAAGNYQILGIAVEDMRAAVSDYAKEAKLQFPIALDLNSTVKRAYRIFGPPATFFIDGHGIIQDVVLGPLTAERARIALKKTGVVP